MSNSFRLQIMASDHMVYDGEAFSVSLPTTEGSVGILANHSNVILAVVPGTLEFNAGGSSEAAEAAGSTRAAGSKEQIGGAAAARIADKADAQGSITEPGRHQVVVSEGLLKVENGEVMILVDTAERPEDIDEARARRAEEQAREELRRANSNRDHAMVEAELSRALSRIKASKSRHKM